MDAPSAAAIGRHRQAAIEQQQGWLHDQMRKRDADRLRRRIRAGFNEERRQPGLSTSSEPLLMTSSSVIQIGLLDAARNHRPADVDDVGRHLRMSVGLLAMNQNSLGSRK